MKFVVNGDNKLNGSITVLGSKNAATPIISATLLTNKPCIIKNTPKIGDVLTLLSILKSMGSDVSWLDQSTIRVVNRDIDPSKIDMRLVRMIRSSILLVGPLLARFGKFDIGTPGGCNIGVRSLDAHLEALVDLGTSIAYDQSKDIYRLKISTLKKPPKVVLKEFSVTATENLMIFGTCLPALEIDLSAAEPHIQDLGNFLNLLGAEITGLGTHNIMMKGIKKKSASVKEITYTVINDAVEAGTFMVLGVLLGGNISIKNVPVKYLTAPICKLREFGANFEIKNQEAIIRGSQKLRSAKIQTLPYPGFPTDLQAPFGVLATQSKGETLIFDTLYEGRLRYLKELAKMGAKAKVLDPHRALIFGKTPLHGANVKSLDLRAGATLVIAALLSKSRSILHNAEQIDRGYEKLEERLQLLGADIKRIE